MKVIEGYRLSPQQKRLWLQRDPSAALELRCAILIEGPLDPDLLDRAVDRLVARHEILRTRFDCLPGMEVPVQVIAESRLRTTDGALASVGLQKVELLRLGVERHQLQLSFSALCADVWSVENLVSELGELYESESQPLDELVQYADFSEWQNELLESEEDQEARQYWLDQKEKLPATVELPLESRASGVSGQVSRELGPGLWVRVQQLAQTENSSVEAVLLACWQTLLWRLSGRSDILIETSFDGRKFEYLRKALGLFSKFVPISSHFENSFNFSDLLRQLNGTLSAAHKRQEYYATELLYDGEPPVGVGFSYGRWPGGARAGGLALSVAELESAAAGLKLQLECFERGGELLLRLHYDGGRYDESEMERLRVRFERLLTSVVGQPGAQLRRLELLGERERQQLLAEWHETAGGAVREKSVSQLFEAQVERTPAAVAVVYEGEQLSYGELNQQANQVAHYLRELGVGPEVIVGLCLERSVEMIVGLLAILKAGGAYLPLDPANPPARLAYMMADAGAGVLLTQSELSERVALTNGPGLTTVCLDEKFYQAAGGQGAKENLSCEVTGENLAYIIYTSGSTGQPKGVMVRQSGVVNLQAALQEAIYEQLPGGLRISVNAPLTFDGSVKQVVQLLSGHTLVLVPDELRLAAGEMLGWLRQQQVGVLDCTPVQLRLLLAAGLEHELQALLVGGEAIEAALWERLSSLSSTQSYNLYGPTECTVDATARLISGAEPGLGRPLQNTQVYVLGEEQELLPVGVAGELYLGGAGVARGYLGQPELTAERFLPHPYSSTAGARLYRTGDVVRWGAAGQLAYLGRADEQVKIRGNRLELGEVEAVLAAHESVRECVVVAREDEPGNKRLVAYVVARQLREPEEQNGQGRFSLGEGLSITHHNRNETLHDEEGGAGPVAEVLALPRGQGYAAAAEQDELLVGTDSWNVYAVREGVRAAAGANGQEQVSAELAATQAEQRLSSSELSAELRASLRSRLPDYMVPSAIVLLERLPLNANGKVDRRALPAPEALAAAEEGTAPLTLTPIEELLAGTWTEVLRVKHITSADNFFDLGGHSLLATQLISRIREVFQIELPLRVLFVSPVLSELAARIEEARRAEVGVQTPPLLRVERGSESPLSFAQQRLWFLDQLEPNSAFYNGPQAVRLSGELKKAALERTLTEIVRRHEVLRTTFQTVNGEPMQVIAAAAPVRLPEVELSELTDEEREAEVRRLAQEEAAQPYDLSRGPLLRVKLLREGANEHVVLMTMHHIISDGWSMGVLINEVATLYRAYYEEQESLLPEIEVQYADFAIWQRSWLQGETLDTQLRYWEKQLGDAATLELPTDRPRPALPSYRGGGYVFRLERELIERLHELSRREGVTFFMTLLAAYQMLLSRYSGQTDIVVGTDIANRNRQEIESLIGFFVNQLVLRSEVKAEQSFRELLAQVKEVCLGAYAHQDVPFEKLVEELRPERDLARSPLFQVKLVLQNAPAGMLELPELRLTGLGAVTAMARFELMLTLTETEEGMVGSWSYSSDLFDEETIVRLTKHYARVLAAVTEDVERPLATIEILTEEERRQLLEEWNDTQQERAPAKLIHEWFVEQVERTPEATAVIFGEEQLSYREVNRRANQLAAHLSALGVGAEVIVGICVERSLEMVVGLLGILKAGGAYLPIDPEYPLERISFMLEDAGVAVLLTHEAAAAALPAYWGQTIYLDSDWELIGGSSGENPAVEVEGEKAAYVLYTSGSTGQPKGVLVPHRALANHMQWMLGELEFTATDRVLQKTPFTFDASVWEFYGPLLCGGTLVMARPGVHRDARALVSEVAEQRITQLQVVPTMLKQLVAEPGLSECRELQRVFCGGEALTAELAERFGEQVAGVELCNLYGPTEATIDASIWSSASGGAVTLGRPIWNTQMYVLGRELELLPVGVSGELYIGGAGLARGYVGRAELTAERFIPHPYSAAGGERLYGTGDLARYLANGELEYLGRADEQVKLRGFRIELGEIEAVLRRHAAVRECVVVVRADESGNQRLVGYAVSAADVAATPAGELREHLRASLPEYMVPGAIVWLDELPLTVNGKIDRRALPAPERVGLTQLLKFAPPRTEVEATLARIWAGVIGVERVGIHDNFFDLGGDSIHSIQMIARAAASGIRLTTKQLFQHQTIAALAQLSELTAVEAGSASWAEQGVVTGLVALTPIQQWFFAQERMNPDHFNQSVMLRLNANVRVSWLRAAVAALLAHHDALRLSFQRDEAGQWQQFNAGLDERFVAVPEVDLGELDDQAEVTAVAEQVQRSLSLSAGALLRAVLLRPGVAREARLLLVIHHLAVDGVSWRILLEDLETAYEQVRSGGRVQLPAKTSSYQQWAARLLEYAGSERLQEEMGYWREQRWERAGRLPLDREWGRNRRADARQAVVALSKEQTGWLLQEAPAAYRTGIQELLLTALTTVLTEWLGSEAVAVDLEGHGREETIADVTRTVGWFTTIYPVLLQVERSAETGVRIKSVKEQLRRVPEGGLSYGVQCHLRGPSEQATGAGAELLFNYLGQLDQILGHNADGLIVGAASESGGAGEDPQAERRHVLEINGSVTEGRLKLRWSYSCEQYEAATIEHVAEQYRKELVGLIEHCRDQGAGGRTPSDYPLARLSQAQVDQIAGAGRAIEDIYPATPLQQGMLFQTLVDQQSSGLFAQSSYVMEGQLDVRAFIAALQEVVEQHASLRTAFVWEGVETPLQVVRRSALLPVAEYDWRELSAAQQQEHWERLRVEDEERGFDLGAVPLMRLALARVDVEAYWLRWSHHHLVLDGWCQMLLLRDLFAAYERLRGMAAAADGVGSRPYRDYVAWLQQQDLSQAERYWRETLDGFRQPTILPLGRRPGALNGEALFDDRQVALTPEQSRRLQERARREQVTLNTVLHGAWALLLARYSGQRDLVFGATVSGRPAELAGVEGMIGLFINTLPVRVRVQEQRPVWEWLRELQDQQVEMRQYEHSPLAQVQQWSEAGAGQGLFETLLVYENFPYQVEEEQSRGLRIRKVAKAVRTKYPLTLVAGMGAELVVYVSYQRRRFSDEQIEVLTAQLGEVLAQLGNEEEWPLAQALVVGEHERHARAEYEAQEQEAQARRETEAAAAAVQDPVLELVRKAISEVLGVVEVGNEDNFFDLGGHSLLATQLVSRLRETFNIELPLRTLFEVPIVSLLARAVEAEMRAAVGLVLPPIQRMRRGAEAVLSFAQQRLWFLDQLEPNNAFYNSMLAVRLSGELRKEALKQTLTEMVRRHEVLRTSFQNSAGRAVQVIAESTPVRLSEIDLSELEPADNQATVRRLAQEEALEPFDLTRGPLLRLKLLRTGPSEHVVLLAMHHIITDAWSMGVFVNEVATLYRAYHGAEESPLPELEVQYADYALWQREWLRGDALEKQLRYWRNHLRGAARLDLPADKVRPALPSYRGARQTFVLTKELSEGIKELSRREGATLFMTLLAAFQTLLSRYSGQNDILVGTVVAGRNRQQLEPLIGLFINTLALRTNLSGDPSFRELLRRVREVCLGAYAHQDIPFDKLVEELQPERELGRSPFFQVTFGLQNAPLESLELSGLELQLLDLENERSRFDLTVWLMERGGRLLGEMTYNTDILEEETIRLMWRRYETLLASIVQDPQARLSMLAIIPEEEAEQLLIKEQRLIESNVGMLRTVKRVAVRTSEE